MMPDPANFRMPGSKENEDRENCKKINNSDFIIEYVFEVGKNSILAKGYKHSCCFGCSCIYRVNCTQARHLICLYELNQSHAQKIIYQVWISLDGYAADANHSTNFFCNAAICSGMIVYFFSIYLL
jgi:hypothetical protein